MRFGLNTTGIDTPDFTYDNRLGSTAYDWLASVRDNFTWTRNTHTFKIGGHFEYMQNNEARGGTWQGDITFSNNTSNPLNTNFAFSNAALGVFSQYTETDKYRVTQNRQWWSEWYLQDTWQPKTAPDPRLRRAVPLLLTLHTAGRPGRELRPVEVRPRPRRRGCTSRRSSTARASPTIRSRDSRSIRSSSAPTCQAQATRPTGW